MLHKNPKYHESLILRYICRSKYCFNFPFKENFCCSHRFHYKQHYVYYPIHLKCKCFWRLCIFQPQRVLPLHLDPINAHLINFISGTDRLSADNVCKQAHANLTIYTYKQKKISFFTFNSQFGVKIHHYPHKKDIFRSRVPNRSQLLHFIPPRCSVDPICVKNTLKMHLNAVKKCHLSIYTILIPDYPLLYAIGWFGSSTRVQE